MHIEPGVVPEAKMILSYATAAVVGGMTVAFAVRHIRREGAVPLLARSAAAALCVFCIFEVLPHWSVGVSEVHLILGSTLFLLFGAAPAAIGLAAGLLAQGVLFSPSDLPQYAMNVTTLLVPLFGLTALADRMIAPNTPYVALRYGDVLALSIAYQGGIVAWVAFWTVLGHGLSAQSLGDIATFGAAYVGVVVLEPLVDLAVLAMAKSWAGLGRTNLVAPRVYAA
jgi:hypothetical protein